VVVLGLKKGILPLFTWSDSAFLLISWHNFAFVAPLLLLTWEGI